VVGVGKAAAESHEGPPLWNGPQERSAMTALRVVARLDDLAREPARARDLSLEDLCALYTQAATVHAILIAALHTHQQIHVPAARAGDRLLGPQEVADRIGKSRSWVQKHAADLPPRRRIGGEGLWSERELDAWLRTRPPWDSA